MSQYSGVALPFDTYEGRGFRVIFTGADSINVQFTDIDLFNGVDTVWIDNSSNANQCTLTFNDGLLQTVKMPAHSSGFIRVFCSPIKLNVSAATGGAAVAVVFISQPKPFPFDQYVLSGLT